MYPSPMWSDVLAAHPHQATSPAPSERLRSIVLGPPASYMQWSRICIVDVNPQFQCNYWLVFCIVESGMELRRKNLTQENVSLHSTDCIKFNVPTVHGHDGLYMYWGGFSSMSPLIQLAWPSHGQKWAAWPRDRNSTFIQDSSISRMEIWDKCTNRSANHGMNDNLQIPSQYRTIKKWSYITPAINDDFSEFGCRKCSSIGLKIDQKITIRQIYDAVTAGWHWCCKVPMTKWWILSRTWWYKTWEGRTGYNLQ